jgi:hypothetical protein
MFQGKTLNPGRTASEKSIFPYITVQKKGGIGGGK